MAENPQGVGELTLTPDEELTLKLVDAIRKYSMESHLVGTENKVMDRYGEELVNTPEYDSAMRKIAARKKDVQVSEIDL